MQGGNKNLGAHPRQMQTPRLDCKAQRGAQQTEIASEVMLITLGGTMEVGSRDDTHVVCRRTARACAKELTNARSYCVGSRVAGSSQIKHRNASKYLQV